MNENQKTAITRPLDKFVGRFGYFIRECLNELRCKLNHVSDWTNDKLGSLIFRLDENPNIAHYRRKDRGI